ncbi:MAG: hypothetical protein JWL60_2553 [Gemmatimonadetes bacterium]|nr:hypothetical protein [Gemmatimonadota bacterium]
MLPLRVPCTRITLASAALILAACASPGEGGDGGPEGDVPPSPPTPTTGAVEADTLPSPQGPAVVRQDSAPGAVAVSADPLQWKGDDVVSRLRQGGLAPVLAGSVAQPSFGPRGLRVTVADGAGEVRAFLFGDANAVALAGRGFDAARVPGVAPGRSVTLLVDNNLGAIVIAADASLGQRIAAALRTSPNGR